MATFGSVYQLGERVRIRFVTDAGIMDDYNDVRAHDADALSWILRIGAVPIDDERDSVTLEISRARYDWLLASMDKVADYVPSAIEAEIQLELGDLLEALDEPHDVAVSAEGRKS